MAYVRRKRVKGYVYVYEVEKVRRGRDWIEQIVRYIGPEDPVHGGRGPVNFEEERLKARARGKK